MINLIAVFIGGGLGSLLRYCAGLYLPFPTLLVNVLGSFILGCLFTFFIDKPEINNSLKAALTIGFCGGLTTFSTFSFQLFEMFKEGQIVNCLMYVLISVILGIGAVIAGVCFAKFI